MSELGLLFIRTRAKMNSFRIRSTYDFFENIDLIEKHSLLVVVHVALTQDFDRALGP